MPSRFLSIFLCASALFATYTLLRDDGAGLEKIKQFYSNEPALRNMSVAELQQKASSDYDAALELSYRYEDGNGVEQSPEQAFAWAEKAALSGDADTQSRVAYLYDLGIGVEADPFQAAMWYKKAAKQDYAYAKNGYGLLLIEGRGVQRDEAEGCKLIKEAADTGLREAEHNVGLYNKQDGICSSNVPLAIDYYQRAANKGDASSMLALSYIHLKALGTPLNEAEGLKWLNQAASASHPKALGYLGWVYLFGKYGVAVDTSKAQSLLKQAASDQQGLRQDSYAMVSLAYMHEKGIGVAQSLELARQYYQTAAVSGNEDAQYRLGRSLLNPANSPSEQDMIDGLTWLKIAASQQDRDAIELLQNYSPPTPHDIIATQRANQWRAGRNL
ncbi:SEL1-like repeat protein [Chitinibacter sp. SCUT-21]|uniref:tetratricopeptide repeat protein n=1 Tax=Chitinibacter sp. SCUT-21 TaxID=2970891 RepID=UPI0035A62865